MIWRKIVSTFLILGTSVAFAGKDFPGYASGEHIAIGNKVKLYFSAKDLGIVGKTLHLPNGLGLQYGDIVALADFYGTPGHPISEGKTELDKISLFYAAFYALSEQDRALNEAKELVTIIRNEQKYVLDAVKKGEEPEEAYRRIIDSDNRAFNCLTGGGCTYGVWWMEPGRFLELAKTDHDHFGNNALEAYRIGHQLAVEQAIYAHKSQDTQLLENAYAMNAFACHFLTDRFSAGHMRTPRIKLAEAVTPGVVGSLLANYMHIEENNNGINVHNLRGDHWVAYGDLNYFNDNNKRNRDLLDEAMQESANQIFSTYQNGAAPSVDKVSKLIPYPDHVEDEIGRDISPLFYWHEASQTLHRRADTKDLNDFHWTTNWWGWTTLIQLAIERGLPLESQAELATSGYGETALKFGLITDKNVIDYIKNRKVK